MRLWLFCRRSSSGRLLCTPCITRSARPSPCAVRMHLPIGRFTSCARREMPRRCPPPFPSFKLGFMPSRRPSPKTKKTEPEFLMNHETQDLLPPLGGLNGTTAPGQEAAQCQPPSPDSSRRGVFTADATASTGGRAARNRRERQRKQRRRAENRRTLAVEKSRGCWLCVRRNLSAEELHFHHLDPKKKRDCVAHLVSRSVSTFNIEVWACRLLCRRCHEQHHALLHSEAWRTGGCYDL